MVSLAPYDQRYIVRENDSTYKTRSAAISLCIACGDSIGCPVRSTIDHQREQWRVQVSTTKCVMFKPVITFKDKTGLHGVFNTFRRGLGWFNRLRDGDVVKIYDADSESFVGEARVTSTFNGSLVQMLTDFAADNHLMKDSSFEAPSTELHLTLEKLYGRNYAALDSEYSVVYVEMIEAEVSQNTFTKEDDAW